MKAFLTVVPNVVIAYVMNVVLYMKDIAKAALIRQLKALSEPYPYEQGTPKCQDEKKNIKQAKEQAEALDCCNAANTMPLLHFEKFHS